MTEIRFYHLQSKTLEQAVPEILARALDRKMRAVVMLGSEARVEALNTALWTFNPDSFLPHGSKKDGHAAEQPIWLTAQDENPNGADLLILADGAASERVGDFKLCCEIFDGNDPEAVAGARARWKSYKDQGRKLVYFQQDDAGKWQEKAVA